MALGPFGKPCWCDQHNSRDYFASVGAWVGICTYNWRDVVAIIAGALNIFFWLILSIPQYRKMFKTKSSQGISLAMLLLWTVADFLGFAGLLISGITSGTLLWLTIFFSINNTFACFFWFYYDRIYPRLQRNATATNHDGYTLLDDADDGSDRVALLSSTDDKAHEVFDGKQPRLPGNHSTLSSLNDDDLLDTPISLPFVQNTSHSINATYAQGGSGNDAILPCTTSSIATPSRYTGAFQTRLLDPTTFSFIIAIIAVASLQVVDARFIYTYVESAVEKVIEDVTEIIQYLAVNNPDGLPYCEIKTLPSTTKRIIGFCMTAICAVMNSISRIPQVKLNQLRKTTAGLSLTFTLYQLTANFFFFFSRLLPSNLEFSLHWFETSFPWVISTLFSTVCLLIIWYQVYWFGNGGSIQGNQFKQYSRGVFDTVIFCLPKQKQGQVDYYDELEEACKDLLDENGNVKPHVKPSLRRKNMARADGDNLDRLDQSTASSISIYDDDGSDDENEGLDKFEITQQDIDAYVESNLGNPLFNISFDAELNNPVMRAMNQSFSKTASFVRSLSNFKPSQNQLRATQVAQPVSRNVPEDEL